MIPTVLANPAVRALWVTELGDAVDRAVRGVALPWLVLETTGSTLSLGLAFAMFSAPDAVLAPLIGHLIDALPTRLTLVMGSVLQGLIVAGIGLMATTKTLPPTVLYASLVCLSVVVGLTHNARRTALPAVADDAALDDANAALDAVRAGVGLAALGTGGWLIVTVGAGQALLLGGVAPVLGTAALWGFEMPASESEDAQSPTASKGIARLKTTATEGIQEIWRNRVIRQLLAFGLVVNLLLVPLRSVLIPTLGRRTFESALALTVLLGAFRAGDFLGTLLAGAASTDRRTSIILGAAVVGCATAAAGTLASELGAGVVALGSIAITLFGTGVGMPLFNVPSSSAVQAAAPAERRGTIITTVNAVLQSVFPLPLVAAGWLLGTVTVGSLLVGVGAGMGVVTVGAAAFLTLGEAQG
ncbi:MAG: MFS transporter [Halobacteriaceae archaeon]